MGWPDVFFWGFGSGHPFPASRRRTGTGAPPIRPSDPPQADNPSDSSGLPRHCLMTPMPKFPTFSLTLGLSLGALTGALHGQALNLARFQEALADSSDGGTTPDEAVDGIVSNDSRWYSGSGGPHWLEIRLTESFTLGSAHLYLGLDDGFTVGEFSLQYANGTGWNTIATISGNSATDLNVIFPAPVVANKFRLYSDEGVIRVKELALFAPNGGSGHPLGTDVTLNLANRRGPVASGTNGSNYPWKAVDGYVNDNSRWLVGNNNGPHELVLELTEVQQVGGVHLYSGYDDNGSTLAPLADFTLDYASGSGWTPIPGGTVSSGSIVGNAVTGNSAEALAMNFATPVTANKIRLSFASPYGRVRELVVLPANRLENGGSGYPLGAGVKLAPRPDTNFKDYHDAWHRIALRTNNNSLVPGTEGSTLATAETPDEDKFLQLLYSPALDAYRIRQQATGKCVQVQGASTTAGAPIVLGDYSAAPHQLWKLVATDNGFFQLRNVWSGMVIASDGGSPASMTQQPFSAAANPPDDQEWKPLFQDDYFKKGTGGWVGQFGTGWGYDWARNDKDGLSVDKFYAPMQHREGWPNLGTLHKKQTDWNNDAKPAYLLGFNEPDRPDQANMGIGKAVELWPRLMAMDVPLVSPACALGAESWWLSDFMDRHDNKGYRCEYAGAHWYAGPSSDNLINYINSVQSNANGRPVWLTEFSVVDWSGGSGNWSEETNYNFILEFLWRAEDKDNLKKYAVFIFSGGSPPNPWTLSNPRSNFRSGNGSLTPFGKAYSAWDGDKAIRDETPYILHNRNARHRLRNDGTTDPQASWIRREDDSVQWILQDNGSGRKHLTSVVDGRRLRYDGSTLDFAPAGTTGPQVEWDFTREQYGWHNIIHPSSGRYLRLFRDNGNDNAPDSFDWQMVTEAQAQSLTTTDWWFVKPWNEADVSLPDAPTNLVATPGDSQVDLSWSAAAGDIMSYSVYRRVADGAPVLLESEITGTSHLDTTAANGTTYYYSVTATDLLGLESAASSEASATPGVSDPNASFGAWAAFHSLPVTAIDHDQDGDGLADGLEYFFLTDPNVANPSPLRISRAATGEIELRFPRNAVASGIDWTIRHSSTLQEPWDPTTHTTEVESTDGTVDQVLAKPSGVPEEGAFFILEVSGSP